MKGNPYAFASVSKTTKGNGGTCVARWYCVLVFVVCGLIVVGDTIES